MLPSLLLTVAVLCLAQGQDRFATTTLSISTFDGPQQQTINNLKYLFEPNLVSNGTINCLAPNTSAPLVQPEFLRWESSRKSLVFGCKTDPSSKRSIVTSLIIDAPTNRTEVTQLDLRAFRALEYLFMSGYARYSGCYTAPPEAHIPIAERFKLSRYSSDDPIISRRPNLSPGAIAFNKRVVIPFAPQSCKFIHSVPVPLLPPSIQSLVLINNYFPVTDLSVVTLQVPNLKVFYSSANNFSGSISSLLSLGLKSMFVEDVLITGSIPPLVDEKLELLGLSGTQLNGTLPKLPASLRVLHVTKNPWLSGTLPAIVNPLQYLNLADNGFSGHVSIVPASLSKLTYLNLRKNNFTSLPMDWSLQALPVLQYFDVSNNGFQQAFPLFSHNLTNQDHLTVLNIARNDFTGTIPPDFFWKLYSIQSVELQYNRLSGTLPVMQNRVNLANPISKVDFSFNQLSGPVEPYPFCVALQGNRFSTAALSSYSGFYTSTLADLEDYLVKDPTKVAYTYKFMEWDPRETCDSKVLPQDVDECDSNAYRNPCPAHANCVNGWLPRLSFTCQCEVAYVATGHALNGTGAFPYDPTVTCQPVCGDGLWAAEEECDLPMMTGGAVAYKLQGCNPLTCEPMKGYRCNRNLRTCSTFCGDGIKAGDEQCDVGSVEHPGCVDCKQTIGWNCTEQGTCTDINECVVGTWNKPAQSNNLNSAPCDRAETCINYDNGTYSCCASGYQSAAPNYDTCQDIDECTSSMPPCGHPAYCFNVPGSFGCCQHSTNMSLVQVYSTSTNSCVACTSFIKWVDSVDESSRAAALTNYPSLNQLCHSSPELLSRCMQLNMTTCEGKVCGARGFRLLRNVGPYVPGCSDIGNAEFSLRRDPCDAPCPTNYTIDSTSKLTELLNTELYKGGFILDALKKLFNLTINIDATAKKRAGTGDYLMSISPCPSDRDQLGSFMQAMTSDLMPQQMQPGWTIDDNCNVYVESRVTSYTWLIILASCIFVVILGLLIIAVLGVYYFYTNKNKLDWSDIPEEISWSFRKYESEPRHWQFRGTDNKTGYHFKDLAPNTKEYARVRSLFDDQLGGKGLVVESITAVYNKVLLSNFLGTKKIISERITKNPMLFNHSSWQSDDNMATMDMRHWVHGCYFDRIKAFPATRDRVVPIIPTLHATSLGTAASIAETGFASLSSLDAGYYGKGIYFTTHAYYAITYVSSTRDPAFLISWAIPGNVYPVIEYHEGPGSLLGKPITSGYNSHFVVVKRNGLTPRTKTHPPADLVDELVVSQESQIAPAFILKLNRKCCMKMLKQWTKRRPEDSLNMYDTSCSDVVSLDYGCGDSSSLAL